MNGLEQAGDWILAAMLVACAVTDVRERRIPNAVTYPALVAGLALALLIAPERLAWAVLAVGIAAAAFAPLVRVGAMGMGDLKLMAAVGALQGPGVMSSALIAGVFVGGLMALGMVVASGRLRATLGRAVRLPGALARSWRTGRPLPRTGPLTSTTVPFGAAIAVGAAVARWGGWPW